MPLPKILITRPIAATHHIVEALKQRGYDPVIDPLLEITPLSFILPTRPYSAILITSSNAIPVLASRLANKHTMVFTVGQATAEAASAAGFTQVSCLGQTVEEAATHLSSNPVLSQSTIVYFSGTHITYDVQVLMKESGPAIIRVPVYAARQVGLEKVTIDLLSQGQIDWIVLFSRRTAEALTMAITSMDSKNWTSQTGLVCLSARTAEPLGDMAWRDIKIADQPTADALIAALPEGA